jgi:hypothetical protein
MAADLVTRVVDARRTCFKRDAEFAQFVLVTLEHPLERLAIRRVSGDRRADLLGGEVTPRGKQADHKAQQPLSLPP